MASEGISRIDRRMREIYLKLLSPFHKIPKQKLKRLMNDQLIIFFTMLLCNEAIGLMTWFVEEWT